MRRHREGAALIVALFLLFFPTPARAQRVETIDCWDQANLARCDAERVRLQRSLYDMPPLAELQGRGAQVRRIFYVANFGEWGRDLVAIAFVRMPGHTPTVTVRGARRPDGSLPPPLVAEVPAATWREVLAHSGNFDREMVPLPSTGTTICLGAWTYSVEAYDPPANGEPANLRRHTANGCNENNLAAAYGRELGLLALPLIASCGEIAPAWDYPVMRLAHCTQLEGDRLAAVEVWNALPALFTADHLDRNQVERHLFGARVVLDWQGARFDGPEAAAARWNRALDGDDHPRFQDVVVRGETGDRVQVEALLMTETGNDTVHVNFRGARVQMTWERDQDGSFVLSRARVEESAPRAWTPAM